ncbi:hypothetical protein QBC38DRAFT_322046, partial [Podospora fimiseda]
LIQQRRLSALVPANNQPTSTEKDTAQRLLPAISGVEPLGENAGAFKEETKNHPRSSERTLDKFARELEEFARSPEAFSKSPASTPTTVQTHTSICTVQEFIPYRQQFQEAGLAVTSLDQRAQKKDKPDDSKNKPTGHAHPNIDGKTPASPQVAPLGSNESSITTVIHTPRRDPLVLFSTDEPGNKTSSEFSTTSTPPKLEAVGRRVIKLRPSTIFLATKPLPITPHSPEPPNSKLPVVDAKHPQASGTRDTLGSDIGTGPEKSLGLVNHDKKSPEPNEPSPTSASWKGKKAICAADKSEKSLPALPVARVPSNPQHGNSLPRKTSWVPTTARQLPTTIMEEKELSPEKSKTLNSSPSIDEHNNKQPLETENIPPDDEQAPAVSVTKSISDKPEILPETWKNAVSTPSSFEKALDDIMHKLDVMGEERQQSTKTTDPQPEKCSSRGKRLSLTKAPSPPQRLERAVAIRQQRIAEARVAEPSSSSSSSSSSPSSPLQQHSPPLPIPPRLRQGLPPHNGGSNGRVPPPPPPLPMSPQRVRSQLPSSEDDSDISDRDVLKGLKIICAASADVGF